MHDAMRFNSLAIGDVRSRAQDLMLRLYSRRWRPWEPGRRRQDTTA